MLAATVVSCTATEPPTPVGVTPAVATVTAILDTPAPMEATSAPTSTTEPAVTPFVPFEVMTWANNVLLRSGPGYLFQQLAVLREGASLLVLGKSPGGEWLLCQTPENRVGWVFAQLVERATEEVGEAPTIWPPSAQVLRGTVRDQAGVAINGIQFSIVQGGGNDAPRNDAVTDESGTFYAFMPAESSGSWFVSYTAVSCKSNTMDANCNCIGGTCGKPDPTSISVEFPRAADEALAFIWK
jgi:hypothetical protein